MQIELLPNIDQRVQAYQDQLNNVFQYLLAVEPMPTPRPRSTIMQRAGSGHKVMSVIDAKRHLFVNVYNEPKYTNYKKEIVYRLKERGVRPQPVRSIFATFFLPYPKSTPKSKLIDNSDHEKKPDWDNYIKGLQDALEDAGIIHNDGGIAHGSVLKRYTLQPKGFIGFTLIN